LTEADLSLSSEENEIIPDLSDSRAEASTIVHGYFFHKQ
jgi:hypothetical protein